MSQGELMASAGTSRCTWLGALGELPARRTGLAGIPGSTLRPDAPSNLFSWVSAPNGQVRVRPGRRTSPDALIRQS